MWPWWGHSRVAGVWRELEGPEGEGRGPGGAREQRRTRPRVITSPVGAELSPPTRGAHRAPIGQPPCRGYTAHLLSSSFSLSLLSSPLLSSGPCFSLSLFRTAAVPPFFSFFFFFLFSALLSLPRPEAFSFCFLSLVSLALAPFRRRRASFAATAAAMAASAFGGGMRRFKERMEYWLDVGDVWKRGEGRMVKETMKDEAVEIRFCCLEIATYWVSFDSICWLVYTRE